MRNQHIQARASSLSISFSCVLLSCPSQLFSSPSPLISGTAIAQADYGLEDVVYEINFEASQVSRKAAKSLNQGRIKAKRFRATIV